MQHQQIYYQNEAYTQFLAEWDKDFYKKYIDALCPKTVSGHILDIGCGVGYVVSQLQARGYNARGVEVSATSVQMAQQSNLPCQLYDGKTLPFPDNFFASVGSLNVLEHVENPELFITELVRVTQKGGHIVLSSPNFYRVIGFRDYHPKMRGFRSKWLNFKTILQFKKQIKTNPGAIHFETMTPIVRKKFQPDDDAIVATNPFHMSFFLEKAGCKTLSISCTDRYMSKFLDFLLNATFLRYLMLNAFIQAKKL
ncbi:MAG: class I SAM-dependent methyltransferase [Verrucomicrobiae bacterium]|nr:class I SAM-dependent methyltransferase [Verrucomicrobiae bacterium]